MSVLQATPLAGRLSASVRSASTRVVLGGAAAAWVALSAPWPGGGHGAGEMVDPWSLAWIAAGC